MCQILYTLVLGLNLIMSNSDNKWIVWKESKVEFSTKLSRQINLQKLKLDL